MEITKEVKDKLINLKREELTKNFIEQNFCSHYDVNTKKIVEPHISFQDEFILKKGEYHNDSDVKTNVGQLIVNKVLYGNCPNIQKAVGYVAAPYTKSKIGEIEEIITTAMLDEKIPTSEFMDYLDNIQWFGNTFNAHLSSSFTPKSTMVLPEVEKRRKELYEKYDKELNEGDVITAVKINDELIEMTKKALKNDPGMELFTSQCKPKYNDTYQPMFITKGPMYNSAEGKFYNSRRAFIEGISKEEIPAVANSVIEGAYPKAIDTGRAGYETKKMFACFQAVQTGPKGSDCGSKVYREVLVTKGNKKKLIKRYCLMGNKLVCLDLKMLNNLVGKTIKIRSPLYCGNKKICNKCIGDLPYLMGIENIGLTTSSIGSGYLNKLMKQFHTSSVKIHDVNLDLLIIE